MTQPATLDLSSSPPVPAEFYGTIRSLALSGQMPVDRLVELLEDQAFRAWWDHAHSRCIVTSKVVHMTAASAEREAQQMADAHGSLDGRTFQAYVCRGCGNWHVGRK